jgi:hypothetical protein
VTSRKQASSSLFPPLKDDIRDIGNDLDLSNGTSPFYEGHGAKTSTPMEIELDFEEKKPRQKHRFQNKNLPVYNT